MNETAKKPARGRSLEARLVALIMSTCLTSTVAVGYLAYERSSAALDDARAASLEAVAQAKEGIVIEILRMQSEQAAGFARSPIVRDLLGSAPRPEPTAAPNAAVEGAARAAGVRARLVDLVRGTSFVWLAIVDAHGTVLGTTGGLGEELRLADRPSRPPDAPSWSSMRRDPEGEAVYRLVVPIRESGRSTASILADVHAERIWSALADRTGLGDTGETYLMSEDGTFLSPALGDEDAPFRRRQRGVTDFVRRVGHSGFGEWAGYRGTPSLGYVMYDDLRALGVADWSIVCEVDRAEAYAPALALRTEVGVVTFFSALVSLVVAFAAARRWTRPIARLVDAATRIGAGDLRTQPVVERRDDEIGTLSETFVSMHGGLREALSAMKDGISVLSEHAAEVTQSARKYGSASNARLAAVASTSVSLAETRRSSSKTAEAARGVLEATEVAAAASRRGLDALDAGVEAMGAIEDRVRGIASEALELSQQSARIGQIVATVNDLSEQSNVLAVNASVEAAKAGDRGKGFAVVAHEVRRLAEQSKRATQQIKRILGDIQRAVESVVMAAEEGTKRSEDGRRAIGVIRATVDELAATLGENATSARHIASSAADQATGIAQLASALETVERSGDQTSKEVVALERSAATLEGLGRELATVALRYEL